MSASSSRLIFKICSQSAWQEAASQGEFLGAAIDLSDGFIHFSAAHQTVETAAKHFAGQTDLVLVAVDTSTLGEALKWETSRGGDLFPHLYGTLPISAAEWVKPLPLGENGHEFPPLS